MKIYISGPIKDIDDYVERFNVAEDELRKADHEVINPADLVVEGWTVEQYMRQDLIDMLSCDAICMLPGWEKSKGATLELQVAMACGFKVYYSVDEVIG